MKVIFCSSSVDISDLKTEPGNYASSKIATMFKNTKPHFITEFDSISNIEYIKVQDYPDFYKLWNDLMNKITFAYNYKYLESKKLFDDYLSFNERIAAEINKICDPEDLVIVNDASLYLLPSMVPCSVAIRNLEFDDCFIERVPYYKIILCELMQANKFFSSNAALKAFNRYLDCSLELGRMDRGGCFHMRDYVDKETVLDVLNCCSIYRSSLSNTEISDQNEIVQYIKLMQVPKKRGVLLTNAPLLHLEAYIKENPGLSIRYIRSYVEIDEKQDRMVQYLKKAYECVIDVIDSHSYSVLALEMFYCDIFVGSKYHELAKLLRKPYLEDDNDPVRLKENIKKNIGMLQPRIDVYGEDLYLQEFMTANGYDVIHDVDYSVDSQIDSYIIDLIGWFNGYNSAGSGSSTGENSEMANNEAVPAAGIIMPERQLYRRVVNGEAQLFIKRSSFRISSAAQEETAMRSDSTMAGQDCQSDDTKKANALNALCKCTIENKPCSCKVLEGNENDDSQEGHPEGNPTAEPKKLDIAAVTKAWNASNKVALLDYDGTLAKIEKLPHLAKPSAELIELLQNFNKKNKCIICTGRSQKIVDEWFPSDIEVYAEHGACHRKDGKWTIGKPVEGLEDSIEVMEYYHMRTPGSLIEKKTCGVAFHYKQAPDFDSEMLYYLLRKGAGKAVIAGKGVIEIRAGSKYKVTRIVAPALVAGDDLTDEDMYDACKGISIRVGAGETKAQWYVENVSEFLAFLGQLID